tara:strand:+ start:887 stop:2074 length:1188 start_codon:yes stop_codon:yes gene_type:complete
MASKKLKIFNLLILLISTLLSLYLCEGYLTFLNNRDSLENKIKIYKKQTGKDYDIRSILSVYDDERKKNNDVAIRYLPRVLLNDKLNIQEINLFPLSGISNVKTINCNAEGFFSSYISDRYGFNNPDDVWNEKEIDFVIIGDSFVHGSCVNRPNDIPSVVRNLTKKNVINLGFRGNGPLIEYATLREYSNKKIKNLIWVYYENDIYDLKKELNNNLLKKYINDDNFSQNLLLKQNKINSINKRLIEHLYKTAQVVIKQEKKNMETKNKILKFIRLNSLKKFLSSYVKNENEDNFPYDELKKIIEKVNQNAINIKSNFFFVFMPSIENYTTKKNNYQYDRVISIIQNLNINFIDLNVYFKNYENPEKFYTLGLGPHLNADGYREASKFIVESINKK